MGKPEPGKNNSKRDHPEMGDAVNGEKPGLWLMGFGAGSRKAGIGTPRIFSFADIFVPEIKFQIQPASPLPVAAFPAPAICGDFHFSDCFVGASMETGD